MELLDWSSPSPDLDPIERSEFKRPKEPSRFEDRAEEWGEITVSSST